MIPVRSFYYRRNLRDEEKKCPDENEGPIAQQHQAADSHFEHICALDIESSESFIRLTGIIGTIGPRSLNIPFIEKMIGKGMNVARINMSHGSRRSHKEAIHNIRYAVRNYSAKIQRSVLLGIAIDLKGPEIRTGFLHEETELKEGKLIKLTTLPSAMRCSTGSDLYVDYKHLCETLAPGNRVLINDGQIELIVKSVDTDFVTCEVENGGMLGSRKRVQFVDVPIDLPAVSERDKRDIQFGVKEGVDIIIASCVRNAATVTEIKSVLGEEGKNIKVVAKIENFQDYKNIPEIIDAADGIMLAGGDLWHDKFPQRDTMIQKAIITQCNEEGKPVIFASQVLSMMTKPFPTGVERSNVTNAILDGADCVMLSKETSMGDYPLEALETMVSICKEAEAGIWNKQLFAKLSSQVFGPDEASHTVAIEAVQTAHMLQATAIMVVTKSGRTAQMISKYRPRCPIIAITSDERGARQCNIYRAVVPVLVDGPIDSTDWVKEVDERLEFGFQIGKDLNLIRTDDTVVAVSSWTRGSSFSNSYRVTFVP